MKRLVRPTTTITFEINLEIVTDEFQDILSGFSVDYDNFIDRMIDEFRMKNYKLDKDEDYTYTSSIPESLSEQYTFYKWIDDSQVIVVVNAVIYDDPDKFDIVFDDQHFKSFTSAELAVNSKIKEIEAEISDLV